MSKLSKVKDFYDSGLWTKSMVSNAVAKNWISEAEYQDITGEAYTAPAVQPSGSETGIMERMLTLETMVDAQEGVINDLLISVIPELLGGE